MAKMLFSGASFKASNNKVPKRDDGAFYVTLGAFNAFSTEGLFYNEHGLRELLTEKNDYNSIGSKIDRRCAKGEANHPMKRPGETIPEFIDRNLVIDMTNASHNILELGFEELEESELPGTKVVLIKAWVLPTDNEVGRSLKADLENENVNVCFSIRCFSRVVEINGVKHRIITKVMTWDWIDNPGISYATKAATSKAVSKLTIESSSNEIVITDAILDELECINCQALTTESSEKLSIVNHLRKQNQDSWLKNW